MRGYTRRRKTKRNNAKGNVYIGGDPSNPCIIVNLAVKAGLGNQLFIYSAGIVASKKIGLPMCILPVVDNFHSSTNYRSLFKQGSPVEIANMQNRLNKATKIHENIQQSAHGRWSKNNLPTNKSRNIAMKGIYYQNYESIKTAIPQVRIDLTEEFKKRYPDLEKTAFKNTTKDKTLFMHVRKGDTTPKSLPSEYYTKAIDIVNGVPTITTIYILSDDIPYCQGELESKRWQPKAEIRWIDDPKDELKTLYLMSMCKGGAIMSSSTYSCWGAFLGPDEVENSVILYPLKWATGNSKNLEFPAQINNKWRAI
jgi:hypothetical protein